MSSTRMTESEAKTDYHLENDNVNFKYVKIPYDSVEDSLVNITDAEIKNYISDNNQNIKEKNLGTYNLFPLRKILQMTI